MYRWMRPARRAVVFVAIISLVAAGALLPPVGVAAQQTALTGTFTTLYIDPTPGSGGPAIVRYRLTDDTGKTTGLDIAASVLQAAGGALLLDRQRVSVTGTPTTAGGAPAVSVQTIAPVNKAAAAGGPQRRLAGAQPFVNVLCKFSDVPDEPQTPAYFNALMGTGAGGLNNYFTEASYGNINLNGTVTATTAWSTLPNPKSTYITGNNNPTNAQLDQMASDCARTIPGTLDMNPFVGLNFMFNSTLGGVAIGGTGTTLTINGVNKTWSSTWMPPWGYGPSPGTSAGQTVLAHEMGHAFNLPHSAGPTGVTYQNSWDVLSETYNFCNNPGATDPTYGCLGQHMIAQDKDQLLWIAPAKKFTYTGTTQTLAFAALADAATPGIYYAVIPHTGTTTQYTTVEFRRPVGYDVKLPGTGVIIHEVDATRTDPAWVVGTDGGAGAIRAVGSVYDVPNSGGVKVTVNSVTATTASVTIGTAGVLQTITVAPNNTGVQIGATVQMSATGNYSNGTTQNLTGSVTWASSAPGVATISAGGLVTGVAPGTTTITATSGAIQGSAAVNVLVRSLPNPRAGGGAGGGPILPLPGARSGGGAGGGPINPLPPRR